MNLTINPIAFTRQQHIAQRSIRPKGSGDFSFVHDSMPSSQSQIFSLEDIRHKKDFIQKTIRKNDLPLSPRALEFVLFPPINIRMSDKYTKYERTGSKFFELYSRYLLHKTHPLKCEGELTDAIVLFVKNSNKARILNEMLPQEPEAILDKDSAQYRQACSFNALLGAIIYENKEGFKTAFKFIDEKIGKNIFPKDLKCKNTPDENLLRCVERQGKSWDDVYQETRFFNEQWHYRIHYKNLILSQANGEKHTPDARNACIEEAARKIQSGQIQLDSAEDELDYTNYKIPDKKRVEELKDFCQKWGLYFKDINLLHRAFLYGEMPDGSALAHCDTYEILEFIGDAALGFCTHEIIQDNTKNLNRETINTKRHAFVRNKNLSLLAERMNLENYTINRDKMRGDKRMADIFEALIGAIFLDGGEDGLDNVYKFLDENFRDDILAQ